jgi:acetyltransferase-like isoleucine patch superfamily enzyme
LSAQGYAVGSDVYVGEGLLISDELHRDTGSRLRIGDRVAIAERVTIVLSSYPNKSRLTTAFGRHQEPVIIEDDAWIGVGAILLPGVTIGEGSAVGAGAVVTRSIPSWSVAVGTPARVIRRIDQSAVV